MVTGILVVILLPSVLETPAASQWAWAWLVHASHSCSSVSSIHERGLSVVVSVAAPAARTRG